MQISSNLDFNYLSCKRQDAYKLYEVILILFSIKTSMSKSYKQLSFPQSTAYLNQSRKQTHFL